MADQGDNGATATVLFLYLGVPVLLLLGAVVWNEVLVPLTPERRTERALVERLATADRYPGWSCPDEFRRSTCFGGLTLDLVDDGWRTDTGREVEVVNRTAFDVAIGGARTHGVAPAGPRPCPARHDYYVLRHGSAMRCTLSVGAPAKVPATVFVEVAWIPDRRAMGVQRDVVFTFLV